MRKMDVKLDYNNLMRQLFGLLNDSKDKNMAFGIGLGLEVLTSYMKRIAAHAIDSNDEKLLEICKALDIVREEGSAEITAKESKQGGEYLEKGKLYDAIWDAKEEKRIRTVQDVLDFIHAMPAEANVREDPRLTPRRPEYEADGYADGHLAYDTAYCPECRHEFEDNINDWGSKFCPDCGQALDWSTEESDEGSDA